MHGVERRYTPQHIEHQQIPHAISEEELLTRAQQGDTQALVMLWTRFMPGLHHAVLAEVQRVEIAEEVLQESFIRIMKGLISFEAGHAFFPWAREVVRNVARDIFRRKADRMTQQAKDSETNNRAQTLNTPLYEPRYSTSPEDQAAAIEMRRLLTIVLPDIAPRLREILELYYFQNMSTADIADHLHIEIRTANTYLYQGRKALEAALEQHRERRRNAYEAQHTPRREQRDPVEELRKTQEELEAAIALVPSLEDRQLLTARLVEHMTFAAIGHMLNVAESTIIRRFETAKQALKEARDLAALTPEEREQHEKNIEQERKFHEAAIDMLRDPLKRVIASLRLKEGLTQEEIALRVHRSVRTVQRQLDAAQREITRIVAVLKKNDA